MTIKDRVKRLERIKGGEQSGKLMIFSLHNSRRPPTDAEIEAYRKKSHSGTAIWNGERLSGLDDYREADNPLTEAELAEIRDKRLAEIRAGL